MAKKSIHVQVQADHLERLARCNPLKALAELIWNALDADAKNVEVTLDRVEGLGGTISAIHIRDDGHGLTEGEAATAFENLGGSWKRVSRRTRGLRMMHGQAGEGRFRAFALGERVKWTSRALDNGRVAQITIAGLRNSLVFDQDEDAKPDETNPGTVVTIYNTSVIAQELRKDDVGPRLAQEFALYLRKYQGVQISFDGQLVDPSKVEVRTTRHDLDPIEIAPGKTITAELTVIEWSCEMPRALVLCDADGFALLEEEPRIQAPDFQFTAYCCADHLGQLRASNLLDVQGLAPGVPELLEAARSKMRDHFRARALERSKHAIEKWRSEEVYPFEGSPVGPVEAAGRQVFEYPFNPGV